MSEPEPEPEPEHGEPEPEPAAPAGGGGGGGGGADEPAPEMPLFLDAMEADQQQHLISLLAQAVQEYGAESAEVQADVVAKFAITPAQFSELFGHCYGSPMPVPLDS